MVSDEQRKKAIECFEDSSKKGGDGHRFSKQGPFDLGQTCSLCGIKITEWIQKIYKKY